MRNLHNRDRQVYTVGRVERYEWVLDSCLKLSENKIYVIILIKAIQRNRVEIIYPCVLTMDFESRMNNRFIIRYLENYYKSLTDCIQIQTRSASLLSKTEGINFVWQTL